MTQQVIHLRVQLQTLFPPRRPSRLTQREFARRAGIDVATLNRFVHGTNVRTEAFFAIQKAYLRLRRNHD